LQIFTVTKSINLESTNLNKDLILLLIYYNMTSTLKKTTIIVKAGDIVYIYYFSYNTRGAPSSEFSNKSTRDLILVLLNNEKENDVRLTLSLKAIINQGFIVTLVLDYCFFISLYYRDNLSV
ncbi:hypothetical protein DL95DRAFT_319806, partial [Leptodontidium sp. 2 PMI_412]